MYKRSINDKAVSPVIAVILMVAITVVLAGVLYVWVSALADTSEELATDLQLRVQDATFDINSAGSAFKPGDEIIRVEQIGGTPIDWSVLTIHIEPIYSDIRYEMSVLKINNDPYDVVNNKISKTGEIIIFTMDGTDIESGMNVRLKITQGRQLIWSSSHVLILN